MKDAVKLMVKVFAVVFGTGRAVVVLLYLLLGAYYVYGRIGRSNHASAPNPKTFIETYDPKSAPDFVPDAQLDCRSQTAEHGPWEKYCSVLIGGRLAAFISREEVKSNLAGWMSVNPAANSH
ncbi:MAG: hypothetical protein WA305_08175 [Candidatus Acidiferrales bacterium]